LNKFRYTVDNRCITALVWLLRDTDRVEVGSVTLIEGGYGHRSDTAKRRRTRRHRTVRAAAPLLIPIALALTLGVILAVSSGARTAHVNQQTSGTITTTPRP
jgi:hypothetical protein